MAYHQNGKSSLYLPSSYVPKAPSPLSHSNGHPIDFGENRRISMPYNQMRQTYYNQVHPDANGILQNKQITKAKLIRRPIKEVIRTLAYNAAHMSNAMSLYRQYINAGHEWETESTRDERLLEDFEYNVTKGKTSMQTIMDKFIFGMLVEGAFCGEVTGNMVEGIIALDPVPPLELAFVQDDDPVLGVIDIIGQGTGGNFRTLQDPRFPNPYFIYDPIVSDASKVWGELPFLAGATTELLLGDLYSKTSGFVDSQFMPKGYFSFDFKDVINAGIDEETIEEWMADSIQELRDGISDPDPTKSVITKMPVLWTLVGSIGKVNLDGLEMLDRMMVRTLQAAYDIPPFLFETGQGQNGLGGNQTSQKLLWQRRIKNYQRRPNEAMSQWGTLHLEIMGSRNKCRYKLDDTDLEGELLIAERDKQQADARKAQAEADEIRIQSGVLSREEARAGMIANDERYQDLEPEDMPELPEPVEPNPDAEPQPEPPTE